MPSSAPPFFIVSAPRSGSTLLRLIMDTHPALAVPPPAWLFDMIYPYVYSYGDLSEVKNLASLAEDMLEAPTVKKWPVRPTPAELVAAVEVPTFAGVYAALHRRYAEATGKTRWGEKTPRNGFWIDEILAEFPGAKFIHILRDGRDMTVDIAESVLLPYSLYCSALMWRDSVTAIRESAGRLGPDVVYEVRYEDLCADAEKALRGVCAFLGEDFAPEMLTHHEGSAAQQWSETPLHARTSRPINTDFCGIFRTRLGAGDLAQVESVIGDLLVECGYDRATEPKDIPPRLAAQYQISDTVTNPDNVTFKRWHAERRRERLARGVFTHEDRDSLMWSVD
jgi:hypothetical protein